MRPIRLEIEGFTSFREKQIVDFSKLRLFAISGPTGAGKTSIIDALLYALYGKTPRGISGTGLITQGAPRMDVLLEFRAGGEDYRISRTLIRNRGSGTCRLEKLEGEERWSPVSGKSREIGAEIDQIIGLSFDGFTRAVVLPQGQFDQFLRGDARDRRKILESLLSLDVCQRMAMRAREQERITAARIDDLRRQLETPYAEATPERLEQERQNLAAAEAKAAEVRDGLAKVQPLVDQAMELTHWRTEQAKLTRQLRDLDNQIQELNRQVQDKTAEAAYLQAQFEAAQKALESISYDPDRHLKLNELWGTAQRRDEAVKGVESHRLEQKAQSKKLAQALVASEAAREEQRRTVLAATQAEQTHEQARLALTELQSRFPNADAVREALRDWRDAQKLRNELAGESERRAKLIREQSILQGLLTELEQREQAAENAYSDAQHTLNHLRERHSALHLRGGLSPGDECPVCLQAVTDLPTGEAPEDLDRADEKLKAAERERRAASSAVQSKRAELRNIPRDIEEVDRRLGKFLADIKAFEQKPLQWTTPGQQTEQALLEVLESFQAAEARLALAEGARTRTQMQVERARGEMSSAEVAHASMERELNRLASEIGRFEQQIAMLDQELESRTSEAIASERRQLEQQREARKQATETRDRSSGDLLKAQRAEHEARQALAMRQEALRDVASFLEQEGERIDAREKQLWEVIGEDSLPPHQDEFAYFRSRQNDLYQSQLALAGDIQGLLRDIDALEKAIAEAAQLRQESEAAQERHAVSHELGHLLKGNNFVDYVITYALKALSLEASQYLEKMSSGRYSFVCEDAAFHVCDRWNADEQRGVDTLSGGESFFASLALALALADSLSPLTAEKSHLRLESLFLDEGFSTLDTETLDVVLNGLEALDWQDRMVGIISHLPELAERMESRIYVRKAVAGSTIEIER